VTPDEAKAARAGIARAWGLLRLTKADLGRALGHGHERDPGQMISLYETGRRTIPPHVAVTLKLYLTGALPPDEVKTTLTAFRREPSRGSPSAAESASSTPSRPAQE
jgi:hypothetical protein